MKHFKMLTAVVLSIVISVAFIPVGSFAATNTAKDSVNGVSKELKAAIKKMELKADPFGYVGKSEAPKTEYPAYYDLTDGHIMDDIVKDYDVSKAKNTVTPVKFQNPFGTCWGFAATAAAEGSIVAAEKAAGKTVDPRDPKYDFSEKYLAWFAVNAIDDPDDPQNGEGLHWIDGSTSADKYNRGGLPFMATSIYASGLGPVLESKYPYKGKTGEIMQRKVDGKLVDYCYSDEDDWSIPESERWQQKWKLKESYMLPAPAGNDEEGDYEYNEEGTLAIKDQLTKGRPVQIGFCADSSRPGQESSAQYINTDNWAHYTYRQANANHAVTVVGYSDTYPKENFLKGHQPPKDGAWLVKNSWGSEEEDFPNHSSWGIVDKKTNKQTGYFWLSYYDQTISLPEALEFTEKGDDETYIIDEHDLMPINSPETIMAQGDVKMANVFTAEESQQLFGLTTMTSAPGTKVDFTVYLLQGNAKEPTDGIKVYEGTETYDYGGFHRHNIPADKQPIIQKGQKYSVIATETQPDGSKAIVLKSSYNEAVLAMGANWWFEGVINEGESYIYGNGQWGDWKEVSPVVLKQTQGMNADYLTVDNFPMKAYANILTNTRLRLSVSGELSFDGNYIGAGGDVSVSLKGDKYTGELGPITWESSDPNVASVTVSTSNDTAASITFNGYGEAYITAKEAKFGTAIVKFSIKPKMDSQTLVLPYANKAEVSWKNITCDGYIVNYREQGKTAWEFVDVKNDETKEFTEIYIKNLKGGKTYDFDVIPYGLSKEGYEVYGYANLMQEATILPGNVTKFTVKPGKKLANLKWKNNGAAGYCIKYKKKGAKSWKTVYVKAGKKKYGTKTFKKLTAGKKYLFKVAAYDKNQSKKKVKGKFTNAKTVKIGK